MIALAWNCKYYSNNFSIFLLIYAKAVYSPFSGLMLVINQRNRAHHSFLPCPLLYVCTHIIWWCLHALLPRTRNLWTHYRVPVCHRTECASHQIVGDWNLTWIRSDPTWFCTFMGYVSMCSVFIGITSSLFVSGVWRTVNLRSLNTIRSNQKSYVISLQNGLLFSIICCSW